MINVFADKYLRNIADYLPDNVKLSFYDPADGLPAKDSAMDALLIRTVHTIDEPALARLPDTLEFLATASAGTDHVNIDLLRSRDIAFAYAAGCNARSVAEYVATVLLIWSELKKEILEDKRIGIVGVGHVGSEVQKLCEALGISPCLYDPPKAERDPDFESATLEDVLSSDILTFHTPLTHQGPHSTYHWMDQEKLQSRSYDLIINTSRGGVVDEQALLKAHTTGRLADFIIDVWENEPVFNDLTAQNAFIKTPHIAGYSIQAKNRASRMVAESLCDHFSLNMPEDGRQAGKETVELSDTSHEDPFSLVELLTQLHPVIEYQKELKKLMGMVPQKKAQAFNRLRSEFPLRNEFRFMQLNENLITKHTQLDKLGFLSE